MHAPDGFIDVPVSAAAGVLAAGAIAVSLRGARRELDDTARPGAGGGVGADRTAPLAGLVAALIFAVQMLNFPVAAGTSGHLLGGALAAILVGPYTGVLCVSVVLLLQAVLFADGGLTALGVNITTMALTTTVVAYALFRGLVKVLPRSRRSVTAASFVAALVSSPPPRSSSRCCTRSAAPPTCRSARSPPRWWSPYVIGLGEAAITALTVGAVIAVRPDLVHGARGLRQKLKLRVDGELVDAPETPESAEPVPSAARSPRRVWIAGLVTSLVLAGSPPSFYASANPDGLEKVAADHGIDQRAEEHATADSPLADYG
ncbi:Cobalt/nickel transport system permease protein OS=Streptomyces albaduncus OX=68172 GN=FHS32_003758 PE=4 SV=1 [Streptomyces griseoloalbus]